MVHWTAEEKAAITSVWQKVNLDQDGREALSRLLVVYPWTQRYFSSFGNSPIQQLFTEMPRFKPTARRCYSCRQCHPDLDNMKTTLSNLSEIHAQKLYVDPENSRRFGEVLVIVLAAKLGIAFTPQVQGAWEKFNAVLVAAMSHGY
ncbi:hypothetical protein GDO86_017214, partial [Hymenochirus boettgeri]